MWLGTGTTEMTDLAQVTADDLVRCMYRSFDTETLKEMLEYGQTFPAAPVVSIAEIRNLRKSPILDKLRAQVARNLKRNLRKP